MKSKHTIDANEIDLERADAPRRRRQARMAEPGTANSRKRRFGAVRLLMALILCGVVSEPLRARAQTKADAGEQGNRFLIVVETSRWMQPRLENTSKALEGMLGTSLNGQIRAGDTLGLWTYGEQVVAGRFPLRRWSDESPRTLSPELAGFLKQQTYEQRARFAAVGPALQLVVMDSSFLTIILLASSEEPIQGTPFDARINQCLRSWRGHLRDSRTPAVIVFQVTDHQWVDFKINVSPWDIETPAIPRRPGVKPVVSQTAAPPVAAVEAPAPAKAAEPAPAPTIAVQANPVKMGTNASEPAKTERAPEIVPPAKAAEPAAVSATATQVNPGNAATNATEAAKTEATAPVRLSTNDIAQSAAPQATSMPTNAPPAAVAEPTSPPPTTAPASAEKAPSGLPAQPTKETQLEAAPATETRTVEPRPVQPASAVPPATPVEPMTPKQPEPVPAPSVTNVTPALPAPPISPAVPEKTASPAEPSSTVPTVLPVASNPAARPPEAAQTPAATVAAATPAKGAVNSLALWACLLGGVVVVGSLFSVWRARLRARSHVSLITKSLDRDKE